MRRGASTGGYWFKGNSDWFEYTISRWLSGRKLPSVRDEYS